ncbi:hypothetical protein NKJ36_19975 [Mesorhizobium sp. M0142]|uniref:hypothetical protein n=1 Tax=unclassified Mesorhizobium TaxID=325217 RepID=UPI003339D977
MATGWRQGFGALLLLGLTEMPIPVHAVGGQFGLEFAIDAPWRLEPVEAGDGGLTYTAIPISVTFHDAIYDDNRGDTEALFLERIHAGTLQEIEVIERVREGPDNPSTIYQPGDLREIERQGWISTPDAEPEHKLCSPLMGRDCTAELLQISQSHAWHASLWYTPKTPVFPGRDIHLQVNVRTKYGGDSREFTNYLVVHAGEAPLPRFPGWIYGDLHYHAQMTDNEGESGYSYRNVVRALGAMGMDFVFATDHASGGKQVDGAIGVSRCWTVEGEQCFQRPNGRPVGRTCPRAEVARPADARREDDSGCKRFIGFEARDLNPSRFAAARNILYGPKGANYDIDEDVRLGNVPGFTGRRVVPQVYLGEELDAWPEMSATEQRNGAIRFGDGLAYLWPDNDRCIAADGLSACRARYSKPYGANGSDSYLVLDEQGVPVADFIGDKLGSEVASDILERFRVPNPTPQPSRQHMIYFPRKADDASGFIPSNTTRFGGASRRLEDLIEEIEKKGAAFLAHPLVGLAPDSVIGPDIVPYSTQALNRAWSSPAILGLQFWNEDTRLQSRKDERYRIVVSALDNKYKYHLPWHDGSALGHFPWLWQRREEPQYPRRLFSNLYHGAYVWDLFLRKGLNANQTSNLDWLPRAEPRKWFMAGGSDAHGDLNFRREGRPCKEQWCDTPVVDTAIGKPRNLVLVNRTEAPLVFAPVSGDRETARYRNTEVIDALAAGRFSVTDGPALRIAIDRNRNGRIDLTDFQMGETFNLFPGEHVPVLIEWQSTPEFGPISKVDLYVGNAQRTFAYQRRANEGSSRFSHGPRNQFDDPGGSPSAYDPDPADVLQVDLQREANNIRLHGQARIFLSPKTFELATQHESLFYVRAFAQADGQMSCQSELEPGSCGTRLAYTNPIWGRYIGACGTNPDPLAIDADGSGFADICERDLTPCPLDEVAPPPEGAVIVPGDEGGRRVPEFTPDRTPRTPAEVLRNPERPGSPANKPAPRESCKFTVPL